ncbi:hypothetical protein B0H10DRAFT_2196184 [Mycena sp. CBHHK59/15]|nr:hypothetical protein B0H10DRAFT_2196184 [Mycena sp. CBHHK59/15]
MSQETTSTTEKRPQTSFEILQFFLANHCSGGLECKLLSAISRTKADTPASIARLDQLLVIFEELGLDIASVRRLVAMSDTFELHCVRCHKSYRPKDNGDTSCASSMSNRTAATVGIIFGEGEFDDGPEDYPNPAQCFLGRHTANEWEVNYNGVTCTECRKDNGCPADTNGEDGNGDDYEMDEDEDEEEDK